MLQKLNQITVKSKLMLLLLGVSLGSTLVVGILSWNRGQAALQRTIFNQLTSVRAAKAHQMELLFADLRSQVKVLSESRTTVEAMVQFNKAFHELNTEFITDEVNEAVEGYYTEEFFPRLQDNVEGELLVGTYRPSGQAARYLQHRYIAANPNEVGEKDILVDAGDGTEYTRHHIRYHPLMRRIIEEFNYYDLFLIDHETGNLVYSVYKETDYATNLIDGPYRQSGLAEVVRLVRDNPNPGAVQVVDFRQYIPSYNAPAAFLGTPIFNGPHVVGILAVQVPIDEIENTISADGNWEAQGLGETGAVYMVGPDLLMRSNSRSLVDNPSEYVSKLRSQGVNQQTVRLVENLETSILFQEVETIAAREALDGIADTKAIRNYLGEAVLSSYAPLNIEGLQWAIVAEIKQLEAFQPIYRLQTYILVATVILVLLVTVLATYASAIFVKPIDKLSAAAKKVSQGDLDTHIGTLGNDEFGQLADTFNEMVDSLQEQTQIIAQKSRENESLLLNILPATVAERMKKGEDRIVDRLPQVTVLYARASGFSQLSERWNADDVGRLLNDLVNAFDEVAEQRDIEKVKTLGERYIAVCGATKPRLDHTKRTVDFVLEMAAIVQQFNQKYDLDLNLRAGIHSGSVMAGVVGTKRFMYDLWGETLTIVSDLNVAAGSNTILVTQEVYDRLSDLYRFEKGEDLNIEGHQTIVTWKLLGSLQDTETSDPIESAIAPNS